MRLQNYSMLERKERGIMAFKDRIEELRKEHGLSGVEASELCGKSHGTWHNWESGKTYPNGKTMELIASTFGVRKQWLETGLGAKTPEEAEKIAEAAKQKRRDETETAYSREDEEKLRDIVTLIGSLKDLSIPKDRKRHIHRTLSAYRTDLENIVLFGEVRG